MFKNILIPTDGSELSQKGVTQGVALAQSLGAKVTAFFAAPPATPIVYRDHLPVGYATPGEHETMIAKAAARHLGIVEKAAKKACSSEALRKRCSISRRYPCWCCVSGAGITAFCAERKSAVASFSST